MDCFANCILILILLLIVVFIIRIPETFYVEDELVDFPTLGISKKGDTISVQKLGIGTDDPNSNLEIQGNNDTTIRLKENENSFTDIKNYNGDTVIDTHSENPAFKVNLNDGGVIHTALFAQNGKVGIGKNNPQRELDVRGSIKSDYSIVKRLCLQNNNDNQKCLTFNKLNNLENNISRINNNLSRLQNKLSRVDNLQQNILNRRPRLRRNIYRNQSIQRNPYGRFNNSQNINNSNELFPVYNSNSNIENNLNNLNTDFVNN